MRNRRSCSCVRIVTLALVLAAGPVAAADYSDPTWPCIQRKVERLSLGLMWGHPVPEAPPETREALREIRELAAKLALRRLNLEDLRPEVAAFADRHDGSAEMLGRVFARAFDTLSTRRTRILSGIGRFSLSQIALSDRIDAARAEMTALMADDSLDHDRIDALEVQIDWDEVTYSDRQSTITYLCETPTLLEQRLYAIAQMLAQHVRSPD